MSAATIGQSAEDMVYSGTNTKEILLGGQGGAQIGSNAINSEYSSGGFGSLKLMEKPIKAEIPVV